METTGEDCRKILGLVGLLSNHPLYYCRKNILQQNFIKVKRFGKHPP